LEEVDWDVDAVKLHVPGGDVLNITAASTSASRGKPVDGICPCLEVNLNAKIRDRKQWMRQDVRRWPCMAVR
jgi:hypothetical protein